MKRTFGILLLLCLLAGMIPVFSSCARDESEKTITLYVYNWGEYISDGSEDSLDVNLEFEKYCKEVLGWNVKVNYSTFSSNEDMYAKVKSGAAVYDVIIPSDYMIQRMISEDMLLPLNRDREIEENIPNYVYISDDFKGENAFYEPQDGNIYSVPYFYGQVGIIYNTEMVPEDTETLGSWDLMWDEDFKGEILQFNNNRDAFGTALYKLGYSVNDTENTEHWQEALELLKEQKKLVQGYVMDEIFYKMKSGSAAIAAYYAGDFFTMYEENDALAFYYPEEGTNRYFDAMCIPKNAAELHGDRVMEVAYAYIDFLCRPDIACANASYTYYASPLDFDYILEEGEEDYVAAVEEYYEAMEEVHEDAIEILYGETAMDVPTEPYLNLSPEGLELINKLWEELKVESSIGISIYIICGVILAALLALAIYTFVKKRRRAKLSEALWQD